MRLFTGLSWRCCFTLSAVEAAFAYQADVLSIAGLLLVVINFTACMLYIRYRGRELRGAL